MKKLIFIVLLFCIDVIQIAYAQNNIENTQDASIKTNNIEIDNTLLNKSKEWNLTPDEYLHYQNLMMILQYIKNRALMALKKFLILS